MLFQGKGSRVRHRFVGRHQRGHESATDQLFDLVAVSRPVADRANRSGGTFQRQTDVGAFDGVAQPLNGA